MHILINRRFAIHEKVIRKLFRNKIAFERMHKLLLIILFAKQNREIKPVLYKLLELSAL